MDIKQEQRIISLKIFQKSFNTNVRPSNFIQSNSTLFFDFFNLNVAFRIYMNIFIFIFIFVHTEKEFVRRLICPRDETGSLYITRVFIREKGISDHQMLHVRCQLDCMPMA